MTGTWAKRIARIQASIVGTRGTSYAATYTAPSGASKRVSGVYESPYKKQTPQDFDAETTVTAQDPRFGVRKMDFDRRVPLVQGAIITIDDEPGCRFRVTRLEDTVVGWTDLILEEM